MQFPVCWNNSCKTHLVNTRWLWNTLASVKNFSKAEIVILGTGKSQLDQAYTVAETRAGSAIEDAIIAETRAGSTIEDVIIASHRGVRTWHRCSLSQCISSFLYPVQVYTELSI